MLNTKTEHKIRTLLERMPSAQSHGSNDAVADELFALSEDASVPAPIRDFCLDASLLARGTDTGPLGSATPVAVIETFNKIKNGLK